MTRTLYKILLWLVAGVMVTSCDIHEYPKESTAEQVFAPVKIHLDYSLELPPYKDIIYTPGESRSHDMSKELDIRYIVNVYRSVNGKDFPQTPYSTVVVNKDNVTELDYDITLELEPGIYKFLAWSDYSLDGSVEDRYYNTANFSEITLNTPHVGNDDYRDAFRGEKNAIIEPDVTNEITMNMQRPLGKYRFIATDFDRFLSRAEEMARAEWEAARAENPLLVPAEMPAVNIDDYKVVVRYPGFMPHIFNMFTNRPADARTGVSFRSRIYPLSDTEAELGFDYVFINGSEAPYTLCVDIYDKNGSLVGSTGSIDVPLMRSMLTTVRGEFLTSKASGGVGVNPEFDGEFNIVIP